MLTVYKIPPETPFPKKTIGNFDTPYAAIRATGLSLDALCRGLKGAAVATPDSSGRYLIELDPPFMRRLESEKVLQESDGSLRDAIKEGLFDEYIRIIRNIAIDEAVRAHVDFLDRKEIAALIGIDQGRLRDILYGAKKKISADPAQKRRFIAAVRAVKRAQRGYYGDGPTDITLKTKLTIEYGD